MRRVYVGPILLIVSAVLAAPLGAQTVQEQLRRVELQTQRDPLLADWREKDEGQQNFQHGGWSSYSAVWLENDDNSEAAADAVDRILVMDNRYWGKLDFEGGSSIYARIRFLDFRFDTGPGTAQPYLPNERLDLDLAYLDTTVFDDYSVRLGRQYLRMGRGLTLNGNYDGAHVDWTSGRWTFDGFLAQSLPNDVDLDTTLENRLLGSRAKRRFAGFNASFLNEEGERYFFYWLRQKDNSDQPGFVPAAVQRFDYDTDYYALGTSGDFTQNLSYYGEGILEKGSAIGPGAAGTRIGVNSSAGFAELAYHPDWKGHPVFTSELAVAGGDPGRLAGISTQTGAASGGVDRNFMGFGRYDFGLALNPRLSNLEVWRNGVFWKPFEESKGFESFTVGTKLSRYRKTDSFGFMSDPQATVQGTNDIGSAVDFLIGWRPYSDLTVLAQWGKFSPGDAYPAGTQDDTTNLFLNVTYSY
ncbi:MAG: alginate export family protein [Candidatus Wallbacteria bacterium]|nr:alginate export family protein [Candidatus Wallbacteria bacterium]